MRPGPLPHLYFNDSVDYIHIHIYIYILYTYTYMYVYTHVCTYIIYTYAYIYTLIYTHTYIYAYIQICVQMHTYACIYIYIIYIHMYNFHTLIWNTTEHWGSFGYKFEVCMKATQESCLPSAHHHASHFLISPDLEIFLLSLSLRAKH